MNSIFDTPRGKPTNEGTRNLLLALDMALRKFVVLVAIVKMNSIRSS